MFRSLSISGLILAWCLSGCGPEEAASTKTEPAKIEHPKESDVYRIILTAKAEQRLQISTAEIQKKSVPRTRTVGGEVAIPDGARLIVTAPWTGVLLNPEGDSSTVPGSVVSAQQTIFRLLPLLSPEREVPTAAERILMANAKASLVSSRIIADGDTKQAEVQVEAAEIALTRARKLLADKAGSERDVDDAIARVEVAKKSFEAAQARKRLLDALTLEAESGQVEMIPVLAPREGVLRTVSSSIGQMVSVSAPLFEIVSLKTMWVRVPVYPGLREQIAPQSDALVRDLGGDDSNTPARPMTAPPSADPLAATVDIFYELPNPEGNFYPGERVEVVLPLAGETESLVVPRAAILYDIHGIAWVYVNSGEHTFERHRVEVNFTTDELAVLSRGPETGTRVVVNGVAELFGTEFGAGK